VHHVYMGASSHVPYCRKLSMAQCRVQCGHPAINEVMYLLLEKIVQAVLFECWLEQDFFTLMLTTSGTKGLTNVAWTWINAFTDILITSYLINFCGGESYLFRFFCCTLQFSGM
jgi:hypothetical protein